MTRINQSEASIYLELDTGGLSLPPLLNTGEVTQSLEPRLKITNQRSVLLSRDLLSANQRPDLVSDATLRTQSLELNRNNNNFHNARK